MVGRFAEKESFGAVIMTKVIVRVHPVHLSISDNRPII